MFYRPGSATESHGLPRDPFKACVVPRPIGWISTLSSTGVPNLAPYSQFNNLSFDPPFVMFSANTSPSGTPKDTVVNAEATGSFVWNLATWELRHACNLTAEWLDAGVDEFERAGLDKEPASLTAIPMVARSPVKFECEYHSTIHLPANPPLGRVSVVIGKVVGVHIADWALTDGILDVRKTRPIARLGYNQYTVVESTFDMVIPGSAAMNAGLEGNAVQLRDTVAAEAERTKTSA